MKKNHSAPAASEIISHSHKIFLQSFDSQKLTENLSLREIVLQNKEIACKNETLNLNNKPESKCKKCNCKNSKCLKLYCECLANGEYCGPDCGCQSCHNTAQYESARGQAISQITEKNPLAFSAAPEQTVQRHKSNESNLNKSARHKGCTCKRSGCNKKYCECYAYGVACGDACRCENCKNCNGAKKFDRDDYATSYELKAETESNNQSIEGESTDSTAKQSVSQENNKKKIASVNADGMRFNKDTLQSLGLFQPLSNKMEVFGSFKSNMFLKNASDNSPMLNDLPLSLRGCSSLNSSDKENIVKN